MLTDRSGVMKMTIPDSGACKTYVELLSINTAGHELMTRSILDEGGEVYVWDHRYDQWLRHAEWQKKAHAAWHEGKKDQK